MTVYRCGIFLRTVVNAISRVCGGFPVLVFMLAMSRGWNVIS
ncbi:putative membrane protein [Mycobacteroides abscessus subsp. bolletii 103]|nr:putative membrane protein [Mycobacteroides abscessus subsp. bolletii 103]EUA77299.1 putative membrane protein [Mycobacteroides abscessus subsp. bolletii 103]